MAEQSGVVDDEVMEHSFRPSENPRLGGLCACGRPAEDHPPTLTRNRNIADERKITTEAGRGYVDTDAIVEFSEVRASVLSGEYVNNPSLVSLGRDRLRDTREELSDARNHLIWFIQEHLGSDEAQAAFLALRHILLAYNELCHDE